MAASDVSMNLWCNLIWIRPNICLCLIIYCDPLINDQLFIILFVYLNGFTAISVTFISAVVSGAAVHHHSPAATLIKTFWQRTTVSVKMFYTVHTCVEHKVKKVKWNYHPNSECNTLKELFVVCDRIQHRNKNFIYSGDQFCDIPQTVRVIAPFYSSPDHTSRSVRLSGCKQTSSNLKIHSSASCLLKLNE